MEFRVPRSGFKVQGAATQLFERGTPNSGLATCAVCAGMRPKEGAPDSDCRRLERVGAQAADSVISKSRVY